MRLLKTKLISEPGALEIEEFDDISVPQYAILSHRWGNDEPTLQDVERGTTTKGGFTKVQQSCDMAKRDGINYIWIDTCCINKESSSELSEAINSMYLWYFKAHRCYAHLADVPSVPFGESEWFTRGWTLQELLAPADLVFLDANWKVLGTKEGLQEEISNCTGIPVGILSGDEDIETCSIAQRMSWAAKRSTKRVEDLAYCLLGIFGINMPLLYGEGERAFIRLQGEIMRVSDDHSLFAWASPDNRGGILATSPAAFKGSGNIIQLGHVDDSYNVLTMSSKGVLLDFQLIGSGPQKLGLALLQCKERDGPNNQIAIYVKDLTGTMQTFQRVRSTELKRLDLTKTRASQYVTRRGYIQTGRIIPTRSKVNDIEICEPHGDEVSEDFVNFAQPEALLHAAREGRQDDVWLMLTRRDIDIDSRRRDEWPAIFHAVNNGHEAVVKMLLAQDADITMVDKYGYTALLLATEKGHENIVKLLLESDASIIMVNREHNISFYNITSLEDEILSEVVKDARNVCYEGDGYDRLPAFVWAAKHQRNDIIKLLLDKSTEVDLQKKYGPILLEWAARGGHRGIAEWLIDRGVGVNSKSPNWGMAPGSIASLYGNEDTLQLLLERGANIETTDDYGQMALFYAVEYGHIHTIKLLLQKGANVEARDNDGQTLLSWAVEHENRNIIKLLLEHGADTEAKDKGGRTPLSRAAAGERSTTGVIELLLENGADIEAKDNDGRTPLSRAANQVLKLNTIKLLLTKGANIEAKDGNSRTPLFWATTERQNEHTIETLLKLGANIEAKDINGQTPLSWAAGGGHNRRSVVMLLLGHGANIETEDDNGRTPLSWAAAGRYDSRSIVKLLLEKRANIEAADNSGRTPLSWAAGGGYDSIVTSLLGKGAKIKAEDFNGQTPLSWAMRFEKLDVTKLLLEEEIDRWNDILDY